MQQKNFLTFLAFALLVLLAWQQLALMIFPPKPKPAAPPPPPQEGEVASAAVSWPWQELSATTQSAILARLTAASTSTSPGLEKLFDLATAVALAEEKPLVKPEVKQAPQKMEAPPAEEKEITLGNDSSFLRVVLTNLGGGVRRVYLNKFQQADKYGQPVWDGGKNPVPMELVADAPLAHGLLEVPAEPSLLLYHYGQIDEKSHPLDSLGKTTWTLEEPTQFVPGEVVKRVVYSTTLPEQGVKISKIYTLEPGDYHVGLEVKIKNTEVVKRSFRYQLAGPHDMPIEGLWYSSTYHNAILGSVDARDRLERQFEDAARISHQAGGDAIARAPGSRKLLYAGVAMQYFASVVVVDDEQDDRDFVQRMRATLESPYDPKNKKPWLDDITVRLITLPVDLPPNGEVSHKYLLYNGPMKVRLLGQLTGDKAVDPALVQRYETKLHLNTLTDYHSQSGWLWMGKLASSIGWTDVLIGCTNLMHWLLGLLHTIIPIYGINIICLTILVRGLMFPISRKQAMTSIKMQALAPEMKKIQEKHADDPQAKTRAVWELYGKHGVNPMGGCLPLILQMPIFLGLYYALQESISFRLAPFLWIQNLSAPDMLYFWGENIPMIADPKNMGEFLYLGPFLNILPIVAIGLMFVQQKLMTPPAMDEQQEMQQKMMKFMMAFMCLAFYKVASGLCIYFIASSLWGLTERKLLPKVKPGALPPADSGSGNKPVPRKPTPQNPPQPNGAKRKIMNWLEEKLKEARNDDKGFRNKGKNR